MVLIRERHWSPSDPSANAFSRYFSTRSLNFSTCFLFPAYISYSMYF